MKIFQRLLPFLMTLWLVGAAEEKSKKDKKEQKNGVKRQIAFGIEAIPGVTAVHAPLSAPSAGGYTLGYIQNTPVLDSVGGFTSHGFDAVNGGYGVYAAPHAIFTTPYLNVQNVAPKTVQLDQGWKGIEPGHGSIKYGHQIAQSLAPKLGVTVHKNLYDVAPVSPIPPQFDFGKQNYAVNYNQQLTPTFSSFGNIGFPLSAKGYNAIPNAKPLASYDSLASKGYSFSTFHATPVPNQVGHSAYSVQPSYHPSAFGSNTFKQNYQTPAHHNYFQHQSNVFPKYQGTGLGTTGHGSLDHAHQLAKSVPLPSHSDFNGNNIHSKSFVTGMKKVFNTVHSDDYNQGNSYQGSSHNLNTGLKKVTPTSSSVQFFGSTGRGLSGPGYSSVPSATGKIETTNSAEHFITHDTAGRSSSSGFNSPTHQPAYNSGEHGDVTLSSLVHTNGHGGGHHSGEKKATSYQSFVIHSYKRPVSKKDDYHHDSHESDEHNLANNYNSRQVHSGESHY